MASQKEIYDYLKKNRRVKFRVSHLAEIFECNRKTMEAVLHKLHTNKDFYKGFDRKYVMDVTETHREYFAYVYFVK